MFLYMYLASAMLCLQFLVSATTAAVPDVPLKNSAVPGLMMPAIGLGTGGYSSLTHDPHGTECWAADTNPDCAPMVHDAIVNWIKLGGKRLDCADSYFNEKVVGKAIKASGVDRKKLFILSKVGPSLPLGWEDTHEQFNQMLEDLQTDYVDSLLIHWPFLNPSQGNVTQNVTVSKDPFCVHGKPTFNETLCRLNTWQAMVEIFDSGAAKSIGVSNFYEADLQEIIDAGMPLPTINQNPYHTYRSSSQANIKKFCNDHGIVYLGYSPFGVADWWVPPAELGETPLKNPVVLKVAEAHSVTPAQVLIQWQWANGVPVNPRTKNATHMKDNLNAYSFSLTTAELATLSGLEQVLCTIDPKYYDCAPAKRQILPSNFA